jgi:hypothetical protein
MRAYINPKALRKGLLFVVILGGLLTACETENVPPGKTRIPDEVGTNDAPPGGNNGGGGGN